MRTLSKSGQRTQRGRTIINETSNLNCVIFLGKNNHQPPSEKSALITNDLSTQNTNKYGIFYVPIDFIHSTVEQIYSLGTLKLSLSDPKKRCWDSSQAGDGKFYF